MNYKLLTLNIVAIMASYLMFMTPVVHAYFVSPVINPQSSGIESEESPETDFFSLVTEILEAGLNKLIPSVQAATCGDYNCDPGETVENCCYDCECGRPDYYCHIETGAAPGTGICRDLEKVGMTFQSISNTSFVGCNVAHKTNVTASVDNQPGGTTLDIKTWYLNHSQFSDQISEECIEGAYPNYYICPVTIPALPRCGEGTFTLEENNLTFNITYNNGRFRDPLGMSVYFPPITIESWECGNDVCEEELGEGYENCCLDCGCGEGDYCDTMSRTVPGPSQCKTLLSDYDLSISDATPQSFKSHAPGDKVTFELEINNGPVSLELSSQTCELSCLVEGEECEAQCSVTCTAPVMNPNTSVYNTSCQMGITISEYTRVKSYTLRPTINFSVKYNNGTKQITDVLSKKNPFTVVYSESYCGDGYCDTQFENTADCCYDCRCPTGEYCDITDEDKNFADYQKAVCVKEETIQLISTPITKEITVPTTTTSMYVAGLEVTTVTTEAAEADINVLIEGKPMGLKNLVPGCSFTEWADNVPCMVIQPCKTSSSVFANSINLTCTVMIPTIPFKDVGSTLNTFLNFTLTYNDGPNETETVLSVPEFPVIVTVVPGCGNGLCEEDLDETANTCCLDCPLPNETVCVGDAESNFLLEIGDFAISPSPPNILYTCSRSVYRGDCTSIEPYTFEMNIISSSAELPDDFSVINYKYDFPAGSGEPQGLACVPKPTMEGEMKDVYKCSIDFGTIDDDESYTGTPINMSFTLTFTTANGSRVYLTEYADSNVTITKKNTEALQDCLVLYNWISSNAAGARDDAAEGWTKFFIFVTIFLIVCAIACYFGQEWACDWIPWLTAIECVAAILYYTGVIYDSDEYMETERDMIDDFQAGCTGIGLDNMEDNVNDWEEDIDEYIEDWYDQAGTWTTLGCIVGLASFSTAAGPSTPPAVPCFTSGTLILMADGTYKNIEDVVVGDSVVSYNEVSGELTTTEVISTQSHLEDYLIINNILGLTSDHPLYVNGEWKEADEIKLGDKLLDKNMDSVEVVSIEHVGEPVEVYNIEVDGVHNYFANDILSYNELTFHHGISTVEGYTLFNLLFGFE